MVSNTSPEPVMPYVVSLTRHLRPTEFRQYVTWISDNKASWTLLSAAMGPDSMVEIGGRPIPQEPMVCRLGGGNPPY